MRTYKSLTVVAALAFITANVSAQVPAKNQASKDPQQIARVQTNQIKQSVTGITPDQESQILATELDYTKSVQNVLNTTDMADKKAIQNKMAPLRTNRDAKMKTILTADQYSQYELSKPEYHSGK
jgi:hypothetical protein